uniref:VHS domain-containing protein n=1 Tax=Poecilia mexicana TaxID=48701 RepID=A0A3B3WYB5_9TELE
GSEASGESLQASERHPGGEGEREPAEPAAGGLQPGELPQLATRLLAHKIQSPQEWEAMQALLVLETCMKNCGNKFHGEVGKFRFLNELIKVVSQRCWR